MPRSRATTERVEALSRLALFENCSPKELEQVAAIMVEAEKPAGSYLTREGKDGGLMFVLLSGEAEILASGSTDTDADGDGRVIGSVCPGDVVGELSLIDGHPRSASVRATSDVRVLQLNADDFKSLVHKQPQFVRNLLRALSTRVREADSLTS